MAGGRLPWMTYADAHKWEAEARDHDVSKVARGRNGFMREYARAGSAAAMRRRPLPAGVVGGATWGVKRDNFVARHLAQYVKHKPYRRWLAMVMWAYWPGPPPRATTEATKKSRARKSRARKSRARRSKKMPLHLAPRSDEA